MFVPVVLRELLTWRKTVHLKRLYLPILETDHSTRKYPMVQALGLFCFSSLQILWLLQGRFLAETDYVCRPR